MQRQDVCLRHARHQTIQAQIREDAYLGADRPRGVTATLWSFGMLLAIAAPVVAIALAVRALF
jgi:hypothetical protein